MAGGERVYQAMVVDGIARNLMVEPAKESPCVGGCRDCGHCSVDVAELQSK